MITFECPECAVTLTTGDGNMGKRIRCPECKKMVAVPDPSNPLVTIECPDCGSNLQIRVRELGTRIECPSCKQPFLAPTRTEVQARAAPVSTTRCEVCGLQSKPEFRCKGCHARFCSEACRQRHIKSTPHGCAMVLLALMLFGTGVVGACVAWLCLVS